MKALEDDRRAALELLEHAMHLGHARERRRPPGEIARVAGNRLARLDEPERRLADPRLGDQTLDVPRRRGGRRSGLPPHAGRRAAAAPSTRRGTARCERLDRAAESGGARRRPSRSRPRRRRLESPSVVSVSSPSASSVICVDSSSSTVRISPSVSVVLSSMCSSFDGWTSERRTLLQPVCVIGEPHDPLELVRRVADGHERAEDDAGPARRTAHRRALSLARHSRPAGGIGGGGSIVVAGRTGGSTPCRLASSTVFRSPVGKSIRPKL